MNKKLISSLIAGLALSAAVPAQASITSVLNGYAGMIYMSIAGADNGSLYANSCTGATNCNAQAVFDVDGVLQSGALLSAAKGAVNGEDSWGIFHVTGIYSDPGQAPASKLWSEGDGSEYLIGSFGGLIDNDVAFGIDTVGNKVQTSFSGGGSMNVYLTNSFSGYNSVLTNVASGNYSDNLGNGVVTNNGFGGTLFLGAQFNGTAAKVQVGDSYRSTYGLDDKSLNGKGYLDSLSTGLGSIFFGHDKICDATTLTEDIECFNPNVDISLSTVNNSSSAAPKGMLTAFTGTTVAYDVPEPGSMALVGLGLMGLAGLRRRKQQA